MIFVVVVVVLVLVFVVFVVADCDNLTPRVALTTAQHGGVRGVVRPPGHHGGRQTAVPWLTAASQVPLRPGIPGGGQGRGPRRRTSSHVVVGDDDVVVLLLLLIMMMIIYLFLLCHRRDLRVHRSVLQR